MAKPPKVRNKQYNPPQQQNPTVQQQVQTVHTQTTQVYQGIIPPPEILQGFENIVQGSAQRLISLAEGESAHRRELEERAMQANIEAQKKQLEIHDYQSRVVFRSDTLGQILGATIAFACIAGSVWLAISGHEGTAVAIAAIPTAAVIKAFFSHRTPPKQ